MNDTTLPVFFYRVKETRLHLWEVKLVGVENRNSDEGIGNRE